MKKEKQILIIKKEPGQPAEVVSRFDNTLEAFWRAVGGYIETVTLASDLCLICNEEGRLQGLPYNTTVCGVSFVGPVLAVGVKGEEFASVKGRMVPMVIQMLNGKAAEPC